jgi:hypothetical protein
LPSPHYAWEPAPPPSSPISLEPGRDDDVALYQDARTGFSHLLPGRPGLGIAGPNDPICDATIHLQDAPITIRYKLESPMVVAPTSAEIARQTATRFASWRAQQTINGEHTDPSWLLSWGAEGAAVATYDVAVLGGPPQREDLFVLVRQRMVYIITWTYPLGFPDDPAYAAFASVAEATMIWDPLRWEQRGRVWPDSSFVGPGVYPQPKPLHNETVRMIGNAQIPDHERAMLLNLMASIVAGAGAPWVHLRKDLVEANRRAVVAAFHDPQLRQIVDSAFTDVVTGHDLRGLAVLLGRALDPRRTSRPPPAVRTPFK